ncbi:hypothetical protein MMC18_006731 [Xylographa bjoerkii]|nr:hypothetical protein [Xylographa bjoerkii]
MIISRGSTSTATTNAGLTTPDVIGFVFGIAGFLVLLVSFIWWWQRPKKGQRTKKQEEQSARQQYDYQKAGLGITFPPQPSASKGVVVVSQRELPHTNRSQLYRPQTYSPKVLQSPPVAVLPPPRNAQKLMTIKIEPPTPTRTRGRTMSTGQKSAAVMSPIPEARVVLLDRLENMARTHPEDAFVSEVPSDASSQYSRYLAGGRPQSEPSDATDTSDFDIDKPNKKYREDRKALFDRHEFTRSEIALKSSLGSEGTDRSSGGPKKCGYLSELRTSSNGDRLTVPRPLNIIKRSGDENVVDMRGLGVGYLESDLDELSRANSIRR